MIKVDDKKKLRLLKCGEMKTKKLSALLRPKLARSLRGYKMLLCLDICHIPDMVYPGVFCYTHRTSISYIQGW